MKKHPLKKALSFLVALAIVCSFTGVGVPAFAADSKVSIPVSIKLDEPVGGIQLKLVCTSGISFEALETDLGLSPAVSARDEILVAVYTTTNSIGSAGKTLDLGDLVFHYDGSSRQSVTLVSVQLNTVVSSDQVDTKVIDVNQTITFMPDDNDAFHVGAVDDDNPGGGGNSGGGGTGNGSTGGGSVKYQIKTSGETEHGSLTFSSTSAYPGSSTSITPKPDDGYQLSQLTVTDGAGNRVAAVRNADGTFTFIMPSSAVTVYALFVDIGYVFPFVDVADAAWYRVDVEKAHRLGIVSGRTATLFVPDGDITAAEVIKLAACVHQLNHEGTVSLTSGEGHWYDTYVDYASEKGIVTKPYQDLLAPVTRAEFADIFSRALPESEYTAINEVKDNAIPDVKMEDDYAGAIYNMYRAGMFIGGDKQGTFHPEASIKRSELAAVISRMMDVSMRKIINL